jgi:hypothetical protein
MLSEKDWRRFLKPGDEVKWNDPDEGKCSFTGILTLVNYHEGDVADLLFTDGHSIEVFLRELS